MKPSSRTGDVVSESANPEFVKWVQKDQLVKSWLFDSLSEDALRVVYGLQSSQEVWYALAKKFNCVSASRKFDLQRRLQTVSKQGKTMADYLKEVKTICDQLDSIGYPVPDQEKIYGILNGLGKEYESVVAVIENSLDQYPCPSYDDVVYRLTGFDDRLQNYETAATTVNSHMAFKYYVILVDNFSRFCWFYPLKLKSNFYQVFLMFQTVVENLFNHKISMFQCDGGGEFVSQAFFSHLAKCGIKQLISCPYTPQQNGIAERKHRHITELGLSMLFDSKVPLKYWVEAFFIANFISNLLPSSSLPNQKSPYETLLVKKPEYSFLRVFCCPCYPLLRPYSANKFEPRSLKCVLLGYNDKYKGYRCIYPPIGRVYISRHVLFEETDFPFATIYTRF